MNSLVNKNAIEYEKNMNWLEDPNNYPWVRESSTDFMTRQGIFKKRQLEIEGEAIKLIGYSELENNAPSSVVDSATNKKHYYRRIFTIRKDDYENYKNKNYYPTEAVDPLTVEAKTLGLSPKKKSQIAVRVPQYLHRKLNIHAMKTGMTQTEIVVSALASYFDLTEEIPLIQRIVEIEKRLTKLETKN